MAFNVHAIFDICIDWASGVDLQRRSVVARCWPVCPESLPTSAAGNAASSLSALGTQKLRMEVVTTLQVDHPLRVSCRATYGVLRTQMNG